MAFGEISSAGSSDSDSGGGAGVLARDGAATAAVEEIGFGGGGTGRLSSEGAGGGAVVGVSSIVECLPVVQGGMARNSSNVKTRALQHFHP